MFTPQMQYTYVSKLSGGEKRRLYLLTVLIKNPNFLILDEPTNDLDLLTLNKLEEFLLQFKGCLILVSHDRYFMDKLTDHLFIFKGNGVIEDVYSSYSDYRLRLIESEKNEKKRDKKAVKIQSSNKLTYDERKEHRRLEREIAKLEVEKSEIENLFKDPNVDYDAMMDKSKRLSEVIDLLDLKMFRWMELDELD